MVIKNFTVTFIYIFWAFLLICMLEKILIYDYHQRNTNKIKEEIENFFISATKLSKYRRIKLIKYMEDNILFDYACQMYIRESNNYTDEQNTEIQNFLNTVYKNKIKTVEGSCFCLKYKAIFGNQKKTNYKDSVLIKYWKEKTNS